MLVFYCSCICKILREVRAPASASPPLSQHRYTHCASFAVPMQPQHKAHHSPHTVHTAHTQKSSFCLCNAWMWNIPFDSHSKWQTSGCRCSQFNLLCAIPVRDFIFRFSQCLGVCVCVCVCARQAGVCGCTFGVDLFLVCVFVPKIYSFETEAILEWLFRINFMDASGSITQIRREMFSPKSEWSAANGSIVFSEEESER